MTNSDDSVLVTVSSWDDSSGEVDSTVGRDMESSLEFTIEGGRPSGASRSASSSRLPLDMVGLIYESGRGTDCGVRSGRISDSGDCNEGTSVLEAREALLPFQPGGR